MLFACIVFFSRSVFAFAPPPQPTGFVNDYANVLSDSAKSALEEQLSALSGQENGVEISIVTIPSLEGEPVEYAAQAYFDAWKIGKESLDNGVLVLLAVEDREIRIHTGYGAEQFLTDAAAGRIIRSVMVPKLRDGDYDGAVRGAVIAIVDASQGNEAADTSIPASASEFLNFLLFKVPGVIVFLFVVGTYITAFFARSKSWWAGGVLGGALGWILGHLPAALLLGGVGLLLDYILSKNYKTWKVENKTTSWRNTWGGFHSSSGSSSGGGFSFGGGSSGGGGASGKW
jgi:uncharacterized protein